MSHSAPSRRAARRPLRPRTPAERDRTPRQAIVQALLGRELTAKELSAEVRLSEKDVLDHLEHIRRGLRDERDRKFVVVPARCLECGFSFGKRERLGAPGRCPICKSERVEPPLFSVYAGERRETGEDDQGPLDDL